MEKSEYWGGSSSRSGGGVWIPGNSILRREAPTDDIDSARTYLKSIVGEDADTDRIDTYIDRGPEALDFLIRHSALELEWVKGYSDYFPEAPGGRASGRSCEPRPFDARATAERRKTHDLRLALLRGEEAGDVGEERPGGDVAVTIDEVLGDIPQAKAMADFEVFEDNAPQTVSSFEFVRARGPVPAIISTG